MNRQGRADAKRQTVTFVVISMVLPTVAVGVGLLLLALWRPELPAPVAIHWSAGGADSFAELWVMAASILGFGLLLPVLISVLVLPSVRAGRASTFMARLMAGVSLGTSLLVTSALTGGLAIQRGLDDAREAGAVGGITAIALLGAVVLSAALVFLIPASPPRQPLTEKAASLGLGETESVMWVRRIQMASSIRWVLYLSAGMVVVTTAVIAPESPLWIILLMGVAVIVVLFAVLTATRFSMQIDAQGLRLRSVPLGWPSVHVGLSEITSVSSGETSGFSEFGGWGLRMAPGARGIILQDGNSLRVERRDKPALVVTVDDADEAADVLASLLQRESPASTH
ncbi:hypothetical protein [Auritidibacter sp. NML100628]|uniref:hypothetical protein n=1 Tax=Auritidibacter sp. NML100628 TaxID=2170742 RepID=UPI000D735E16|nr:hypothetical protein [Auritidibacter sp. NML100628]PXA78372.1 hypothetical protein DCC24_01435 [Auritidibacter sp. NML100628]